MYRSTYMYSYMYSYRYMCHSVFGRVVHVPYRLLLVKQNTKQGSCQFCSGAAEPKRRLASTVAAVAELLLRLSWRQTARTCYQASHLCAP